MFTLINTIGGVFPKTKVVLDKITTVGSVDGVVAPSEVYRRTGSSNSRFGNVVTSQAIEAEESLRGVVASQSDLFDDELNAPSVYPSSVSVSPTEFGYNTQVPHWERQELY